MNNAREQAQLIVKSRLDEWVTESESDRRLVNAITTALEAREARIAELETALSPFAIQRTDWGTSGMEDEAPFRCYFNCESIRRAAEVLQKGNALARFEEQELEKALTDCFEAIQVIAEIIGVPNGTSMQGPFRRAAVALKKGKQ